LRQTLEIQPVWLIACYESLRVGDLDFLDSARWNRKDARTELVARLFLEQCWVLPAVQKVLVDLPRSVPFDNLGFLPTGRELHREAAYRCAWWQGDAESPLSYAIFRVAKAQVKLGEGQGSLNDGATL
jgi:hypothetical protein